MGCIEAWSGTKVGHRGVRGEYREMEKEGEAF